MMRQVSSPVRRGAGRKGQEMDLARGLPSAKRRHLRGGVSKVEIDAYNILEIKDIGVAISTFETLP